jgi:hypothetical protein
MTTTISPQPAIALTVTRTARREHQLTDEHGCPRGSLRVGWLVRRGEIAIEHDATSVCRHLSGRVTAGEGDHPLVRLSRTASFVPGP